MAALNKQDVVDVGSSGALVQRQPLKTNVSWQVFVQHSRTYDTEDVLKYATLYWLKVKKSFHSLHRGFISELNA